MLELLVLQPQAACAGAGRLLRRSTSEAAFCWCQVLFADTFKFFLSLYGHKLPVLALDVSSRRHAAGQRGLRTRT